MRAQARRVQVPSPDAKAVRRSIELLLRSEPDAKDEEDAIRRAARRLVERALALNWTGPPFDPRTVASLLGIRVKPSSRITQEALIRPRSDGKDFEIVWKEGAPATRLNFTIAHEISHTFFPDCAAMIRYRAPTHRCDPERPLEKLCDIGASELLLPFPHFPDDVRGCGISVDSVDRLRERYVASREAVARRMVECSVEPCAAVFLSFRLSLRQSRDAQLSLPTIEGPRRRWRVDMMFASPSFGTTRMPKHKSVPDDSCLYSLLDHADMPVHRLPESVERWPCGRAQLPPCRIEAMTIPPNGEGDRRALALLYPVAGRRA